MKQKKGKKHYFDNDDHLFSLLGYQTNHLWQLLTFFDQNFQTWLAFLPYRKDLSIGLRNIRKLFSKLDQD